ncbi:chymotrypsin-2-like [Anthonomus grandis grandis]|uniref:chymotrypsin-2-like n=1 Tax=Anthonomus grandis grandis TaxID=2921223 RepID=UPI002166953D|nr:chymotrypsin-2-like [Anthonomus grandis grandis]
MLLLLQTLKMRSLQLLCVVVVFIQLSHQAAIENRIVNGKRVSIEDYPYQVALFKKEVINDKFTFGCGGSIISQKYILTAAHCVSFKGENIPAEHIFLMVGKSSVANFDEQSAFKSNKIIVHPNYKSTSVTSDIAIINLKDPIKYSSRIKPIRLPNQNALDSSYYGKIAVATGYGLLYNNTKTTDLHAVNLTMPKSRGLHCDATDICIPPQENQRGICSDDSGGPLVINGVQYGIISNMKLQSDSDHFCQNAEQFNFANVVYYREWISTNSDVDDQHPNINDDSKDDRYKI